MTQAMNGVNPIRLFIPYIACRPNTGDANMAGATQKTHSLKNPSSENESLIMLSEALIRLARLVNSHLIMATMAFSIALPTLDQNSFR